jgi:hypothetical protein
MRDRNSPFALVQRPVAGLRRVLDAVEGKLRRYVEREDIFDGGWGGLMRGIKTLGVVQDSLLSALLWNERVRKKVGMLSRPEERLSWRKRFGGLVGFEAWEAKVRDAAFPTSSVIPASEPGSREGEYEGAPIGGRGPGSEPGMTGKKKPEFRLARIRPINTPNPLAKSPHERSEDAGSPSCSREFERLYGGPGSPKASGNLRQYQIEVWPVELMWRRERRRRDSRKACGERRERSSRGMMMARARRAAARRARGSNYDERSTKEVRVRGSPLGATG